MKSTIAIEIAAPPRVVFDLAHDVERWPRLLPHYVAVRPLERRADGSLVARMIARRPTFGRVWLGLPVAWRALTWNDPVLLRLRFEHQGGATNGMSVTWRIEPSDRGCRVSIEHDFRPRIAPWALFVDRAFTRPIAGRTLRTFRTLAEAVQATERTTGTSRPT